MSAPLFKLEFALDANGNAPFEGWFSSLKDKSTRARIQTKIELLKLGNFSNCRSLGGGVHELKVDVGPGYRVYFVNKGNNILILLGGGSKRTQAKDITTAKGLYRRLKDNAN